MFGFDEVEVFRRHRHGFPVEAAFEEQRTAGVISSLEPGFEFLLQARVLFGCEVAVTGGVDKRAGGTRRIVEQRFVPAGGRVVDVDGGRGGFDGRKAVVVVERVEQFRVQDAADDFCCRFRLP